MVQAPLNISTSTGGSALVPSNNPGLLTTPTPVTLPTIPNSTPPAPQKVTVVTPALAQQDLSTKQQTATAVAGAVTTQAQNNLARTTGVQPAGQQTTQQPAVQQDGQQVQQQPAQQQTTTPTAEQQAQTTVVKLPSGVQANYNQQTGQLTTQDGTQLQWAVPSADGVPIPGATATWIDPNTGQPPQPGGANGGQATGIPATGDPTTDYILQTLNTNQQAMDAASATHQQQLNQLLNGTFPLTADQQAQVSALQSHYDQLVTLQKQANANYANATSILGIRSGIQQYSPALQASAINNTVTKGIQAIADLDTQAAGAVATLKQGFLDNDYTQINASYKDLQDAITAKNATLSQMQTAVKNQVDIETSRIQQQSDLLNVQTTEVNNLAQSALSQALKLDGTLDLDKIQSIADDNGVDVNALYGAVIKAQEAETTFQQSESKFASDQLQAGAQLKATEAATAASNASTAKAYNDIKQSNLVGNDQVLQPYIQTFYDGTQYADLSSLTPTDKAKYAQVAQAAGIKPILDAGTAGKLNAISDSKTNLQKIGDQVSTLLNSKDLPAAQGVRNTVHSFFGDADVKAFSAWRTAVINNVQALAGGQGSGLRINQAEIDTALKNDLPVIEGPGADNLAQAQQKIKNLNSQLDTWSKQILGGGNQATDNQNSNSQVTAGSTINYGGKTYSVDAQGNLTPQ